MIEYSNGGRLIESVAELQQLPINSLETIECLFADFETTSFDDDLDSLNPWHHCDVAGIAITANDIFGAWYVPINHEFGFNLPENIVADWWLQILAKTKRWINHNVKYDAHVSANALGVLPREDCELYDTIVHAKLLNSDLQYRGGYGLDNLSKVWLGQDILPFYERLKTHLGKSKDYGRTRAGDMAEYATQDAITNRRLYKFIEHRRPPECDQIATLELDLTPILFGMEREGLCVDVTELQLQELEVMSRMLEIDVALSKRLRRTINPNSRDDVYDVLINQFGLPIVEYTTDEENDDGEQIGNASFNKAAMAKYLAHPLAQALGVGDIVEHIAEYRQLSTFTSLFLRKYQELHTVDSNTIERLHPLYNQLVRTGRMSGRDPNPQQLNKRAKKLIHPAPGYAFLSFDQSQIEFRVIVHYINDEKCIAAYNSNPDTDFHDWVAKLAGIKRAPAKTMNFMMGYGGGKAKAVKTLSINRDIVGGVVGKVDQLIAEGKISEAQRKDAFDKYCTSLAEKVYDDYHDTLPTLKPTSRRAGRVCSDRGYVYTMHGRRRHLDADHAHNAFNSVCQGTAADIQKERTIACARAIRGTEISMVANVHDETLFHGPIEVMRDERLRQELAYILEHPNIKLRVPLRVSCGYSENNWCEASESAKPLQYNPAEFANNDSGQQSITAKH